MKKININDIDVVPVIVSNLNEDQILGYQYFKTLYTNIYICSKRKSGKSTVIYNILKNCVGKKTNVVFFCSTIHRDDTYKKMLEMLEKKKVNVMAHTHFIEEKHNILQEILAELDGQLAEEKEQKTKKSSDHKVVGCNFDESQPEERRERKPKKLAPEWVFVFDDLGADLRDPSVTQLVKVSRHYKCKVIFSSQYLHDLNVSAIKNIDVAILFRSFDEVKLLKLYEGLDVSCTFQAFVTMYRIATEKPFNFFYVDTREGEYRMNFNEKFILDENDID
jgi:glycerophosphoryl diester phosphodiesterase